MQHTTDVRKFFFITFHPIFRQETTHIVEKVAFENAKLKILGQDKGDWRPISLMYLLPKFKLRFYLEDHVIIIGAQL